jgi:hypothetical protein
MGMCRNQLAQLMTFEVTSSKSSKQNMIALSEKKHVTYMRRHDDIYV